MKLLTQIIILIHLLLLNAKAESLNIILKNPNLDYRKWNELVQKNENFSSFSEIATDIELDGTVGMDHFISSLQNLLEQGDQVDEVQKVLRDQLEIGFGKHHQQIYNDFVKKWNLNRKNLISEIAENSALILKNYPSDNLYIKWKQDLEKIEFPIERIIVNGLSIPLMSIPKIRLNSSVTSRWVIINSTFMPIVFVGTQQEFMENLSNNQFKSKELFSIINGMNVYSKSLIEYKQNFLMQYNQMLVFYVVDQNSDLIQLQETEIKEHWWKKNSKWITPFLLLGSGALLLQVTGTQLIFGI